MDFQIAPIPETVEGEVHNNYWYMYTELSDTHTSYSESYQTLIKAHLQEIKDAAQKVVDTTKGSANYKKYSMHLTNIFSDRSVYNPLSITVVNVVSFQCAVLFTLIDYDKDSVYDSFLNGRGLFRNIISLNWDNFNKAFDFISEYKTSYGYDLDKLSLPEGATGFSKLDGRVVVTLLGDMTLYELLRSLADNIYLIALSQTRVYADARFMSPLTFLLHDMVHMEHRMRGYGSSIKTRNNLKRFLDSAQYDNLPLDHKHICNIWLFLITHEDVFVIEKQEEYFLRDKITDDKNLNDIEFVMHRGEAEEYTRAQRLFFVRFPTKCIRPTDFYYGILPSEIHSRLTEIEADHNSEKMEIVREWLQSSWTIFTNEWNKSFDADGFSNLLNNINSNNRLSSRHRPAPIIRHNSHIKNMASKWNSKRGGSRWMHRKRLTSRKSVNARKMTRRRR